MVVILIVPPPSSPPGNAAAAYPRYRHGGGGGGGGGGAGFPRGCTSPGAGSGGERSTSTTSISFVSSSDNHSSSSYCFSQVDPDNLIATTKEEEWVTKKKVELTTKKQIETRVKRQVVLEDGKIVEDSGPIVTTNTTEDTEKQEHQQTEHRQLGDDGDGEKTKEVVVRISSLEGNPSLLKETREKKIKSREEKEELVETEDVVHLGDISDEAYKEAVQSKRDIREALEEANHKLVHVNSTGPRIVHQSTKNRKVTDTEDTRHTREVQQDGKIVTETSKTTEHEEVNGTDEPDSVPLPPSAQRESLRESSHRYAKTKDQELVEYLADGRKIGEQMRYEAVNEEGDRLGDAEQLLMANAAGELVGWDSLSERVRKMRDRQQQQHPTAGKTLADFDEEERTRKVETAKWLEHHFGSESTGRSSTGNLSEEEEDDDDDEQRQAGRQKTTSNSFINVTMKSTETPANGYFKGVSEWKAGGREPATSTPVRPPVRRKRDQRTAAQTAETAVAGNGSAVANELESSPLFNSVQQRVQGYEMTREKLSGRNAAAADGHNNRSRHADGYGQSDRVTTTPDRHSKSASPDPYRSWDHRRRRSAESNHHKSAAVPEPKPDYSPEPERRASNGSAGGGGRSKKVYQKTRFATDSRQTTAAAPQPPSAVDGKQERKKSFGESFRRLVGKFTGGGGGGGGNKSDADRKKNRKKPETDRRRAESGDEYEYDYGDDDDDGGGGGGGGNTYRSYGGTAADNHLHHRDRDHGRRHGGEQRLFGSTQTLDRHRAARTAYNDGVGYDDYKAGRGEQHHDRYDHYDHDRDVDDRSDYDRDGPETSPGGGDAMNGGGKTAGVHRYYLGEDPFGGSIYGREREYDGGYNKRRGSGNKKSDHHNSSSTTTHYVQRTIPVNTSSTTLGRFSKSTGRLLADDYNSNLSDRAQTLPRKLRTESKIKKQVYTARGENDYGGGQPVNGHRPSSAGRHNSGSMINVSFASNGAVGPAKPQRTFSKPSVLQAHHHHHHHGSGSGSALGRSHSFSVTDGLHHPQLQPRRSAGGAASPLHRLDESPPPLRSPNIVSIVSRSTKDLHLADDGYRSLSGSWAAAQEQQQQPGFGKDDAKKKVFMKGLLDHAPELYRTLNHQQQQQDDGRRYSPVHSNNNNNNNKDHRPYSMSSSGHSSASPTAVTNRTVTRRGSRDDYSETVRITSKSDDPYRPSVTNTVQNFSKKTVPARDGRVQTIESTETKTVTKSRYSGGGGGGDAVTAKVNGFNPAGGVVIEVRNGRN